MGKENDNQFFKMPLYFFDYGLQVFSHTEYDIMCYILRNTIGWNKLEFESSIKTISLMKRYSEKNIIKAINNLIEKTGVFNKIVYREQGSYIKKTKYIITENSVNILNDYVKKNIPPGFETKKKKIKDRNIEANERLEKLKQELIEKQKPLLENIEVETPETEKETIQDYDLNLMLELWQIIINTYNENDNWNNESDYFFRHKRKYYEGLLDDMPKETDDNKIDIRLSDLIQLTRDEKTINLYKTLIKNKKFIGGQKAYFYNTLKMSFGIKNESNFDRINIIFDDTRPKQIEKKETKKLDDTLYDDNKPKQANEKEVNKLDDNKPKPIKETKKLDDILDDMLDNDDEFFESLKVF